MPIDTIEFTPAPEHSLRRTSAVTSVAVVGTYLPRKCGIATFTGDLVSALSIANPEVAVQAVALNDAGPGYCYPPEVAVEIGQHDLADYAIAARRLNREGVEVVSVQHEFGIFGGVEGSYIIELLSGLNVPVVTTLHTVLRQPSPTQRTVIRELAALSERLVVMSETGKRFLLDAHGISERKVVVIPHGVPDMPFVSSGHFKPRLGLGGRKVVMTFGLLSPNKGIEVMLRAMPAVARCHPDALYVVLGAAHPQVRLPNGRPYGQQLHELARELDLDEHVIFYDRFVELEELCLFLAAADIYVTPYLNEDQIASGTLAYALATGKATISTPYWCANELLADGRGRTVPFGDPDALAHEICSLFSDDAEREAIGRRAYDFQRPAVWREVGRRYLELFQEVREGRAGFRDGGRAACLK